MSKRRIIHDPVTGQDVEHLVIDEVDGHTNYNELKSKRRFLIQDMFDCGEIHLLAGPSGSGKTTWLLQMMKDWQDGKDILKHKSYPEKFVYLSCDRSKSQLGLTLERIGLQDWNNFCAFSIAELEIRFNIEHDKLRLEDLPKLFPWSKVFFIEALGWFMPDGKNSSYNELLKFWSKVKVMVEQTGITIIGTTHCPKAKPREKYANPRDRVVGSVAQAGVASTIIVFEFADEGNVKDKSRIVTACLRNAPNEIIEYELDSNGKLIETLHDPNDKKCRELDNTFWQLFILDGHEKSALIVMSYFHELRGRANIARATMFRYLKVWVDRGILLKVDKDTYQLLIHLPQSNNQVI